MLHFDSDYMKLCHPLILERMAATASNYYPGYGTDDVCSQAKEKIRQACQAPEAEIHFLQGGTQTNAVAIDTILHHYEGVISSQKAHIAAHEAGAIEALGHKVITLPHQNGKIAASDILKYLKNFFEDENWEHTAQPGMVYITHPTEYGTLYSLHELQEISEACHSYGLPLYLDGARLGYGLTSDAADVTLPQIAQLCDAFYIGGTKVGAMLGEALVITNKQLVRHFFTQKKRLGALLAKEWLVGLQFDVLFTDNLYFSISRHANDMANLLREGLKEKGFTFHIDSPTNQQFVIVTAEEAARISQFATFGFWEFLPDNRQVIRFATSWYTREEEVRELLAKCEPLCF